MLARPDGDVWAYVRNWHKIRLQEQDSKKSMSRNLPTYAVCLLFAITCTAQEPIIQTSNTTENLRGLSVPTNTVAWASGTHGTYVRTTDAGISWTAAQVPGADALDFRDVEAFSADLVYLLAAGPGEQSRIYKTRDAGRHWTLQFTNQNSAAYRFYRVRIVP